MKKTNMSLEQQNNLINELSLIVFKLKKFTDVEGITMFPHKQMKNKNMINNDIIKINIIINNYDEEILNTIDQLNKLYQSPNLKNKLGCKIIVTCNSAILYRKIDDYPFSRNILKELYNYTILYDKSGEFCNIQEEIKTNNEINEYINTLDCKLSLYNLRK